MSFQCRRRGGTRMTNPTNINNFPQQHAITLFISDIPFITIFIHPKNNKPNCSSKCKNKWITVCTFANTCENTKTRNHQSKQLHYVESRTQTARLGLTIDATSTAQILTEWTAPHIQLLPSSVKLDISDLYVGWKEKTSRNCSTAQNPTLLWGFLAQKIFFSAKTNLLTNHE